MYTKKELSRYAYLYKVVIMIEERNLFKILPHAQYYFPVFSLGMNGINFTPTTDVYSLWQYSSSFYTK